MTKMERIRSAVKVLSTLTDKEWDVLERNIPELKEVISKSNAISYCDKILKVSEVLKEIGMPANLIGYYYMREAIIFSMDNPKECISSVTKIIYPTIAKKFETTAQRVERGIRHAIEATWSRENTENINKIFKNTVSTEKGKPTNSQAILLLAEYMELYVL